ncbi:protein KHNYN [Coregonus clupeaformis]|uniref:protein KHNYN n=1 Tax=Coregonus clupeaformis TaxID=59861 RepID=UPI001BE0AB64|nr:protein KHNYN [Coregonus clupeaformis]
MASALSHLSPMSVRARDGWSDEGRGEEQVEDEFACSGALRGALQSFHPTVERIFGVTFTIGREEAAVLPHDGQIWLKLKGERKDAVAAKLFVKGVVNQEAQQEVPYPGVLHCVFCGARGLFMECLIRNTSAYILVGSPGFLLISGLAEPVVRAYSLITDLVEHYKGTQGRRTEPGDRGSGETLDSRRAFKSLVERWEDRHTLDLLVLPGAVKETLLDLMRESGLGSNPGPGGLNTVPGLGSNLSLGGSRDTVGLMDTDSQRRWDSQSDLDRLTLKDTRVLNRAGEARDIEGIQGISTSTTKPPEHSTHNQDPGLRNVGQLSQQKTFTTSPVQGREMGKDWTQGGIDKDAAPRLPIFHSFLQTEEGQVRSPQEVEDEEQGEEEEEMEVEEGEGEMLLSVGSREEFGLLLKFFTAMGYAEDVVLRVLARTGPREASQILDLVQQEHDQTGLAMNRPVEMEHREVEEREATRAKEKRGLFPLAAQGRDLPALTTVAVDRRGLPTMAAGAVVTGQQRFLEGLQTPFDLKLTDQTGDPGLRMVIIDGSNIAMSHGLGHFFSCRGIALAVQHFWNRGHRRISTFLPQWRQKRDHRGKEQHYLSELQNLGLLSYTPSREVQGKRINSYDDRFMLQLAQKTDGVIVTNDNLRDLLDESHVWRDIIKKRLLQYTFVGDHFMVPDDPLGRGGPHLDDFLRSQHRPPVPGIHSFSGVASSFHSPRAPRAQTEVLQFCDWTPGVVVEPDPIQARGNGEARAGCGGPGMGLGLGPGQGLGLGVERSAAETSRLRESLSQVFPGQDSMVTLVLQCNPTVTDINSLSHFILEGQTESEQGGVD